MPHSPNGSGKSDLGRERIADELWLKVQIRVSPRTVRKYIEPVPGPHGRKDQRWSTFIRNHARGIVACDFFVSVTVGFRVIYVFVALEIESRRLLHFNVTVHPTSDWTLQQLREALPSDQDYKFLLHDRHKTFSTSLDETVESWGIRVLRSPVRTPTANAHCERLIGDASHCREPFVSGPAITMLAGRIARWDLAFPVKSSRLTLFQSNLLNYPRLHV